MKWPRLPRLRGPKVEFSDALVFAGVLVAAYGIEQLAGVGWACVMVGVSWAALGLLVKS